MASLDHQVIVRTDLDWSADWTAKRKGYTYNKAKQIQNRLVCFMSIYNVIGKNTDKRK